MTEARLLPVTIDTKGIGDDGTIEGYASTWTPDQGGDLILKGAFAKTLATRPITRVKMLREHEPRRIVGVWLDAREDERGLYVKGRVIMDTTDGREAHALMRAGALDGLSIGYRSIRDRIDRAKNLRVIEEVDLLEISVVTFPMNATATVTAVKADETRDRARRIVGAIQAAEAAIRRAK